MSKTVALYEEQVGGGQRCSTRYRGCRVDSYNENRAFLSDDAVTIPLLASRQGKRRLGRMVSHQNMIIGKHCMWKIPKSKKHIIMGGGLDEATICC